MLTAVRSMAQRVGQLVVGLRPVVGLERLDLRSAPGASELLLASASAFVRRTVRRRSRGGPPRGSFSACLGLVRPVARPRIASRPDADRAADRLDARRPSCRSSSWRRRSRGIEVAVRRGRAARAEDDVRADQPGEEHDLGGQEQPHADLARGEETRVRPSSCGTDSTERRRGHSSQGRGAEGVAISIQVLGLQASITPEPQAGRQAGRD